MYANSLYNERLLCEDYRPDIKAYYFRNWNNYSMDFHFHDRVEIMYIINGTCEIHLKDYEVEKIIFKKGDFILINAGVLHKLIVSEASQCKMMNIEFIFTKNNTFLPSLRSFSNNVSALEDLLKSNNPYYILKDYDEVYQLLKSLVVELNSSSVDQGISVQLLMYELLIKTANAAIRAKRESASDNYVNKTKRYISMNYDRTLSLKEIASYSNINEDYLNRVFKKSTGTTVIEYLTEVRIDKAKMLLQNTNIPIIDVAEIVGISSRQYFNQIFKKVTGLTPSKYRKSFEIKLFG